MAPRVLKVGAGKRGKASLGTALKAVVRSLTFFLRAMGAMEGFREAQLHWRLRFAMWLGWGEGKAGDRRTGGRLSQLSEDRDSDVVSAGMVEMAAAVPGWTCWCKSLCQDGEVPRAET